MSKKRLSQRMHEWNIMEFYNAEKIIRDWANEVASLEIALDEAATENKDLVVRQEAIQKELLESTDNAIRMGILLEQAETIIRQFIGALIEYGPDQLKKSLSSELKEWLSE